MGNSKSPVIVLVVLLVVCIAGSVFMYSQQSALISDLEASNDALENEVDTLKANVSDLEGNVSDKDSEISDLTTQNEDLIVEVTDLEAAIDSTKTKFEEKVAELDSELERQTAWNKYVDPVKVMGEWVSIASIDKEVDFDPTDKNDSLYFKRIKFTSGKAQFDMGNGYQNSAMWVDDNVSDEFASEIMVKTIDGNDYLFYEWKTGDYLRGNGIGYYVFERAE